MRLHTEGGGEFADSRWPSPLVVAGFKPPNGIEGNVGFLAEFSQRENSHFSQRLELFLIDLHTRSAVHVRRGKGVEKRRRRRKNDEMDAK